MNMPRIPEPELMTEAEQAEAYAAADFAEPHARVIALFRETFPDWAGCGWVLDLGCGPGDIALRFARAYPGCRVDGVDGAQAMLEAGKILFAKAPDCADRVTLHRALLPRDFPPREFYDAVISNSLLHHLHEPSGLWETVRRHAAPGAPVFIIDLMRPESREQAQWLTDTYTVGEPEVLKHDFFNSLLAAFTVDEVREQLAAAGLSGLQVKAISDRHLMVWGWRLG